MKGFNEWCNRIDERLKNFNWKEYFSMLFPFFKRQPKNETGKAFLYKTKLGSPIQIRSIKNMSNMEMLYGSDVSLGTNFALDTIKVAMKREICDEIMRSDLFEWSTRDTQTGTQIEARIIINKFN